MTTDECMNVLTGLERQLAKEVGAGADKTIEVEFASHHGEPVVNSYKVSGPRSALPASISAAANLALFGSEDTNEPVILSADVVEPAQATATGAAATNPETTEPKESLILEPEVKPVEIEAKTSGNNTAKVVTATNAANLNDDVGRRNFAQSSGHCEQIETKSADAIDGGSSVYVFGDAVVRTARTDAGEPLFCLADVCKILDLTNPSKVASQIRDEFDIPNLKLGVIVRPDSSAISVPFVTEPQLYFVLYRSRSSLAKSFRRWVDSEVLPSIRKTGAYSTHQTEPKPKAVSLETKVNVARIVLEAAGITGNQLALALDKGIRKDTGESSLEWTGTQLTAPTQERLLNPTELGKPLGLSPRTVNSRLQAKGLQVKGVAGWELTEKGKALGGVYLDTGKKHSSGVPVRQIKWPSGLSL